MSKNLISCTRTTVLEDVARLMVHNDVGAIPVVDSILSLRPVGIITDRDIVKRSVARGINPLNELAGDYMSVGVYTILESATIQEALRLMEQKQIRRLVAIDFDAKCSGVLAQADIALNSTDGKIAKLLRHVSAQNIQVREKIA
jgi:CBS domain-containing protein